MALSLFAVLAGQARGQMYSFADLGEAVTGGGSHAYAISNTSLLTGTVPQNPACNPCRTHAFRVEYRRIVDIGVPGIASPPDSEGYGVNNSNQIVGRSTISGVYVPALWLPAPAFGAGAGWQILPQFPGGSQGQAWGINDVGQIAGEARLSGASGPSAVLWNFTQGLWQLQSLGTLGGNTGRTRAVNNLGQAVGQAAASTGTLSPFLWLPAPAYGKPAGMNGLDAQRRAGSMYAINEVGQCAGDITPSAAVWLPSAAYGRPAGLSIVNLSEIPGVEYATAYGITSSGVIIGQLGQRIGNTTYPRGWVWENGHARLLSGSVLCSIPVTITDARGVNNAGQIAASGTFGASTSVRGITLTPLPACYANCDHSTSPPVLNVNDFQCFLNQFALLDPYNNCDGSTTAPQMNVVDFQCFLNKYAVGCP